MRADAASCRSGLFSPRPPRANAAPAPHAARPAPFRHVRASTCRRRSVGDAGRRQVRWPVRCDDHDHAERAVLGPRGSRRRAAARVAHPDRYPAGLQSAIRVADGMLGRSRRSHDRRQLCSLAAFGWLRPHSGVSAQYSTFARPSASKARVGVQVTIPYSVPYGTAGYTGVLLATTGCYQLAKACIGKEVGHKALLPGYYRVR